jgi:Cu/Zn superoxide dismutase
LKLRVVMAAAFVCLAATACETVSHASAKAGSASAGAGQAATVSAVVRDTAKPVVFDCLNHAVAEPGNYILTCADAGSVLANLTWTSWTSAQAVAVGVHKLNDCTPDCAEGKFNQYPAAITFWRPEPVAGHPGETYFSRITVRYTTSHRPPTYMNYNQFVHNPAQWSEVLGG